MSEANEGRTQTTGSAVLWAWWDAEKKEYRHLYPSELCVRMCSPDGYKRDEVEGRGKVMQVRVTPNASVRGGAAAPYPGRSVGQEVDHAG